MDAPNLYERKLLLFTGKGGVGKTTVASAFALSCAKRGERTLLIEMNTQDKVSSMFGAERVGTEIAEVEENLYAVNVTPAAAIEEYAMMMLRVRVVYKTVFENRIVRSFLRSIPGLNELVMLGKAYFHVIEEENGRPVWDKVIVDAPATGHGIFLLQIPSVITKILSSGHMFDEAERILKVMQDPKTTALNVVTLAEEMPVNETAMLVEQLHGEMEMPLGVVFANGLYEPLFTAGELDLIGRARASFAPDDMIPDLFDAAEFRAKRVALQKKYVEKIDELIAIPRVDLPFYFVPRVDFPTIRDMGERMEAQLIPSEEP